MHGTFQAVPSLHSSGYLKPETPGNGSFGRVIFLNYVLNTVGLTNYVCRVCSTANFPEHYPRIGGVGHGQAAGGVGAGTPSSHRKFSLISFRRLTPPRIVNMLFVITGEDIELTVLWWSRLSKTDTGRAWMASELVYPYLIESVQKVVLLGSWPGSRGKNLAGTVLCVPYLLDSGCDTDRARVASELVPPKTFSDRIRNNLK